MISRIEKLQKNEEGKIRRFMGVYDAFIANCYDAKEDYIQTIRHTLKHALAFAASMFLMTKVSLMPASDISTKCKNSPIL